MCNSRPTQLVQSESNTPESKEEAGRRDPAILDPRKKASLAKLFMHNPQFAEAFFKARIGEEGMTRFHALQAHIARMPDEGLKVIMDQRVVGTLTLLSQFFDPSDPESIPSPSIISAITQKLEGKDTSEIKDGNVGNGGEERVKMNKWCWIFLGAWTVGEAGRVLERRKPESSIQVST